MSFLKARPSKFNSGKKEYSTIVVGYSPTLWEHFLFKRTRNFMKQSKSNLFTTLCEIIDMLLLTVVSSLDVNIVVLWPRLVIDEFLLLIFIFSGLAETGLWVSFCCCPSFAYWWHIWVNIRSTSVVVTRLPKVPVWSEVCSRPASFTIFYNFADFKYVVFVGSP
jgi:hypothetical protein